ncbi:biopolymer transporter ExbD [Fusobacterium sp. IOR10]|uniref:ExbD/TolR family protein n=1 Tax=Fusobacterium sp. IOR10 TaxID=2665157 RepID=UPI0013D37C4A|nr:biopolymer transporter ExbD [Fusobacterium sp. IOR10]
MGRYRKKRELLAIDLTPLIDVVFLLLIFFMVTTTFDKYGQIDIEVPTANMDIKDKKVPVEIVIDKNEKYYIIKNGEKKQIDIDNLNEVFQGTDSVSVTGDKNLKYQIIIDVITKIKKQGIKNLGINFNE